MPTGMEDKHRIYEQAELGGRVGFGALSDRPLGRQMTR